MAYRKTLVGCFGWLCVAICSLCQAQTHADTTAPGTRDSIAQVMVDRGIGVQEGVQIEQQERLTVWAVAMVLLGGLGVLLDKRRKECDKQAGIS